MISPDYNVSIMKSYLTFLFITLLISSQVFAGEKGGNTDGEEIEELLEMYRLTSVCPLIPKRYCETNPEKMFSTENPELRDFLDRCCPGTPVI